MLESAVARILNQLLGKYVEDLDTENLNVGIFSGKVQLTDLKLKAEAFYELHLPIEVKVGTIAKIWLQIPWSALWSQPIIINIEGINAIVKPIIGNDGNFNSEKNKHLFRGHKKRTLELLEYDGGILGGPSAFAEHLVSNILNYLQINITNIHIRYEDEVSWIYPITAGLCINSITAQTTNSKWKKWDYEPHLEIANYLIKIEAISIYWNIEKNLKTWNFPLQYYEWRNAMANSLEHYSYEGKPFKFILKPMMIKIKMTINKTKTGHVKTINTEIIVQDCNVQIVKKQYDSIMAVIDNLNRMIISWEFLGERPKEKILKNKKLWWKYIYWATLEQRFKPYTWNRIKKIRNHYRKYRETYEQILENPNDTELKLDLQKYEDNLPIINIIIARQHTRLKMKSQNQNEKNFWCSLPSPEKIVLCEKIGYNEENGGKILNIDHIYNFKLGNFNLTFANNNGKEILITTLTQIIIYMQPNFIELTYKLELKCEGIIIEGNSDKNHNENLADGKTGEQINGINNSLSTILSSEHLHDSPAFFFTMYLEKMKRNNTDFSHKLHMSLSSVECYYDQKCINELATFFQSSNDFVQKANFVDFHRIPEKFISKIKEKLSRKWDINLNIKIPYLIIPDNNSNTELDNNNLLIVIDLGKYSIRSEICQQTQLMENTTKMEMEEQLYSKLHIDCTDFQILFCDKNDDWKNARKEKESDMHLVVKTGFKAIYALAALDLCSIPRLKFNISINTLKLNMSERKIGLILKFLNIKEHVNIRENNIQPNIYEDDKIKMLTEWKVLKKIQKQVIISDTRNYQNEKVINEIKRKQIMKNKSIDISNYKNNMNEAWARTVDLPGLEDNISPSNTIDTLYGLIVKEFLFVFSKSNDCSDRQYIILRLGQLAMDVAYMTYGPAYQMSIHNVSITDKLHITPSGQYIDLLFTPLPNTVDVVTILYRKVSAKCPDFWTHFHGVETSLVANFDTIHLLLHQEALHTLMKYSKYISKKIQSQTSPYLKTLIIKNLTRLNHLLHSPISDVPVPPGSVKFSQSARMCDLNMTVCNSDFDIVNIQLSGLEIDFLFRANERFVFRSYLGNLQVDHMTQFDLYSKILYTDEDNVFEIKYVRNATHIKRSDEMLGKSFEENYDGQFKLNLGQIHCIFLYKLLVQLQRFIIDLEALDYLEKYAKIIRKTIKSATATLQNNTKISLSINVCGPVIIVPQKSSSPNVMVIDTGKLTIENFFKDSDNATIVVENIMVKLKEVMVTRGVIGLTQIIEMQETLIEPTCLKMDIKKFTNIQTNQKNWEVDAILEKIEVTLGQKDMTMMLIIYTDNIGEAKLTDLLPEQIHQSPIISEIFQVASNDVRELEAFFSEPKQKFLISRCKIDEVKIILFFDVGELLSSPIRDLNHGLCKLEVNDIDMSLMIYSDQSSDGKLSIDKILLEEIGPDVNIDSKIVLNSPPPEDTKSTNMQCNITVNKPPIVDVTFHQNKNQDRCIDVIIGRMCLSLSIPFCKKVALYILECFPKDIQDLGIVNLGYEGNDKETKNDEHLRTNNHLLANSLTISIRINKPEFMFLIETTSNNKRYFLTKSEIMIDFSRHPRRFNLVTSLSGLHSLFYDLNEYSDRPYVIMKQCDIEFGRTVEDNNEKICLNVSGIYIKLCSEVVHSIIDILNDITEHFKVPEMETNKKFPSSRKESKKENEVPEDLWEAKKLHCIVKSQQATQNLPTHLIHQCLTIPKFEIIVIFELEETQVLLIKSSMEMAIYDWNYLVNCIGKISIQSNYFNEFNQKWEPVIDPVVVEENRYRPWECEIKLFQDKAQPINDRTSQRKKPQDKKSSINLSKNQKTSRSYTTTESEDSGEDMMYLEPTNASNFGANSRRVKTSLSTFLDDSDSENEDGAMEKLAAAISDLFTGDWNEHEDSECENSSDEENDTLEPTNSKITGEIVENHTFEKSLYLLINGKDPLEFTITPAFLKVFNELITRYSTKIISVKLPRKSVDLTNDIGPKTVIELYKKGLEDPKEDILICRKRFENEDSLPGSPINIIEAFDDENLNPNHDEAYDFETIKSLQFPRESTGELLNEINRNFLKILIPDFAPLHTNCSKKNWEKLVKLQLINTQKSNNYYLAVKHTIGRNQREITVSSPLQIQNQTCFALNIYYKPGALHQLNIDPIGELTNPFQTTVKIATIEPQENYNVLLYIAYHCKLFIQPAHAEGQYMLDSGIWWRNMATEMDTAYNFTCKPKDNSNTSELFALRIVIRKNLLTKYSLAQSVPNYIISLLPPLIVDNFLPYSLEVQNMTLQTNKIEPGEKCSIYTLDLTKDQKLTIKITYNSYSWKGQLNVTAYLEEKTIQLTSDQQEDTKELSVNVKCDREKSYHLIFYVPYWIVNKTGLPLQIKASSSYTHLYQCPIDDILPFTYKRHCKQTLSVRVYESNWSNEFGIECSGTTGLVICKDNERKKKYLFFLNTSLSTFCPRLTKIVKILPSFLIRNCTETALRFMEYNEKTDLWIDLDPYQTLTFWPETTSMQIYIKFKESKLISQAFLINYHHKTVLRMDKVKALVVEVNGGLTGPFNIQFTEYKSGDCPVLIENHCADLFLKIQQQDQSPVTLLSPYTSLFYTWDDPIRPRIFVWNVYNNKGTGFIVDITKNGYGEEKIKLNSVTTNQQEISSSEDSDSSSSTPNTTLSSKIRKDKIIIYWACFINPPQRTLVFTQEQKIYENILTEHFYDCCHFESIISISTVGLSIFTSETDKKEHIYASITNSPAIWEVNVGEKWKTLTLELASWIEDKYKRSSIIKKCQIKDYVHIDFEKMFMIKPFFAEIRRTYTPAIYWQLRKSPKFQYSDFRLNYLQIDNKHSNSIVFHPIIHRHDISEKYENLPLFRMTLLKQIDSISEDYQYVKIKIGDSNLNLENDLLVEISELFKENKQFGRDYNYSTAYIVDIKSIRRNICSKFSTDSLIDQKRHEIKNLIIENFGIQLNISSSMQIKILSDTMILNRVLDHLFPYNMAPYMPLEGVHHKILSIEWKHVYQPLLSTLKEAANQIICQFLQHYYSHVLGLQVLVNTFAISSGIAEISHPDISVTASNAFYASRCLLGHINMSPAALETFILDVYPNLNLEIISGKISSKKRNNNSNNSTGDNTNNKTFSKIITNSAMNFTVNIPLALNQLFVKSHNVGTQCDGEMFFKTIGKALYSLIVRHPDQKTDCIQLVKEALNRATLLGEPIRTHQRLTRYRNVMGLSPFSLYDSIGQFLLEKVGNTKFANENYWTHVVIDGVGKSLIIISLEHVIKLNKYTLWGNWEIEWLIHLDEIISLPKISNGELILILRQNENLAEEKEIKICATKEILMWLYEKLEQAMLFSMEGKSWSVI